MNNDNLNKEIHKDLQKLITEVKAVSGSIKGLTRVIDKNMEPKTGMTVQAALRTLAEYCTGIQHCTSEECEIYHWCTKYIGAGVLEDCDMEEL